MPLIEWFAPLLLWTVGGLILGVVVYVLHAIVTALLLGRSWPALAVVGGAMAIGGTLVWPLPQAILEVGRPDDRDDVHFAAGLARVRALRGLLSEEGGEVAPEVTRTSDRQEPSEGAAGLRVDAGQAAGLEPRKARSRLAVSSRDGILTVVDPDLAVQFEVSEDLLVNEQVGSGRINSGDGEVSLAFDTLTEADLQAAFDSAVTEAKARGKVEYKQLLRSGFVLTGREGEVVFYDKAIATPKGLVRLAMRYPVERKAEIDPQVGSIMKSFRLSS